MIESIEELRTFVRIVSAGSLSRAANTMGITLATASKRLMALEARAGVRLINRTTRALAPSDEGKELYERAERILLEIDAAETMLRGEKVLISGLLRVSAPVDLGVQHISPACSSLVKMHPGISIDLVLSDRLIDLSEDRIDVVIRFGDLRHSTAIVRKLADNHRVIVSTASYVEANGSPSTPDEIVRHNCLIYGKDETTWRLLGRRGERCNIKTMSRLLCGDRRVVYSWMLDGMGLMMMDWIDAAEEVSAGRLVHILPYWQSEQAPLFALYPANQSTPPKVKAFLATLESRFNPNV